MPATELQLSSVNSIPSNIPDEASSDASLLRRYFNNGESDAMEELFKRHAGMAYRLALSDVENAADADEIVQTAFLKVLLSDVKEIGNVRGWIMSIVINTCHNKMKEETRRRQRQEAAVLDRAASTAPDSEKGELVSAAITAVKALPRKYRLPVWLHHLEGLSFKEVGSVLSLPEETVCVHANRGIEQVRQSLAASGFTAGAVVIPGLLASAPVVSAPVALTTSFKALIATKAVAGVAVSAAPAKGLAVLSSTKLAVAGIILAATAAFAGIKYHGGGAPNPKEDTPPAPTPVNAAAPVNVAVSDWPQWQGPNRNSMVLNSPKLIDKFPADGPRLVWKTEGLPMAPLCGIGSPILAGGKVFTYAHTVQPLPGIKPFEGLLTKYGYSADMPPALTKTLDEAQFGAKRAACKTDAEIDSVTKELLDSLDSAQARTFGEIIKLRMKHGNEGLDSGTLASFSKLRDQQIDSREDFLNWFVENWGSSFYHGAGSRIITPYANETYKAQHVVDVMICLDQVSGRELWRMSLPGVKKSYGTEYGCSGTPVATRDRVYFRGSGGLYCLDVAKKGELVWQVKGPPGMNSPLLVGNVVYCILDKLYAFDAATGKELWNQPSVSGDIPTPVLWTHAGKNYLLSMMYGPGYYMPFLCINAETGKAQWKIEFGPGDNASYAVSGDIAIVRGGNLCAALALSPEKAEVLWKDKKFGDMGGAPIVYKDHVYLCGHAYGSVLMGVVDLKTGNTTLNEVQDKRRGECTSPLLADDKIFMTGIRDYRTCHLIVARANPDKYEELGCMSTVPLAACSSPAFADGNVFVRLSRGIACYDFVEHGSR
jgi:RNA polymerase sigma factor (sigma-70 family)